MAASLCSGQGRGVQVGGDAGGCEDAVLAARAVQDCAAFGELYDRYAVSIYRYCYRRIGSREQAEDATSAIFMRALEALPDYRGGSFRAWLFTIAQSVLVNTGRRKSAEPLPPDLDTADPAPSPEDLAVAAAVDHEMADALLTLPAAQRRVVELRLAGLTGAEIAEVLGRSVPAVKMLQLRAMKHLRRTLERPSLGEQ